MNLHEECLLKYLKYPDGISVTTETLLNNNLMLAESFGHVNFVAKVPQISYTNYNNR